MVGDTKYHSNCSGALEVLLEGECHMFTPFWYNTLEPYMNMTF